MSDTHAKALALIVLLAVLGSTFAVRAQQSDISAAPLPPWNDNALITVQKHGGDPTRPGDVKIEFYGHDAFKITSPAGLSAYGGSALDSASLEAWLV